MGDLITLSSPGAFVIALLGLFLIIFEKNAQKTGPVVSFLSVAVPLAALFMAALFGASWTEISILILADLAALFTGNRQKEA